MLIHLYQITDMPLLSTLYEPPSKQLISVLERQPLRAYDAVQLACALTVRRLMHQRGMPPPLFVAADDALLAAAAAEGFAVDNPLLHPP